MKRILVIVFAIGLSVLSACSNSRSVGIIGGADEPSDIYEEGYKFGKQYEKRTIRMFNVDGDLYFDSGIISDATARCGVLDGTLRMGVSESEIPKGTGTANFEIEGYQNATSITKEVNINGEWVIFKKYRGLPEDLENYKYSFYIKGRLNNAENDSELVVLSDREDVDFNDVHRPLLSSQLITDGGYISFNMFDTGDPWGITLSAKDITSKGLTIVCEQLGGSFEGELITTDWYILEVYKNDSWQESETKLEEFGWNDIAYIIAENDITEFNVNWEWLYGDSLPQGSYRINKEIMNFIETGNYERKVYSVYFTID